MMAQGLLDEAAFEQLEEKLEVLVQEAVTFAEESPWPDVSEMYKDVYVQSDYPYITD
jgi:pyruvate dehydrogenase E1 component alpha subunit